MEVGTGLIQRNKAKADFLRTVMPISVYHLYTRVYAQTLVGRLTILMGSQWVIYIATHATFVCWRGIGRVTVLTIQYLEYSAFHTPRTFSETFDN